MRTSFEQRGTHRLFLLVGRRTPAMAMMLRVAPAWNKSKNDWRQTTEHTKNDSTDYRYENSRSKTNAANTYYVNDQYQTTIATDIEVVGRDENNHDTTAANAHLLLEERASVVEQDDPALGVSVSGHHVIHIQRGKLCHGHLVS